MASLEEEVEDVVREAFNSGLTLKDLIWKIVEHWEEEGRDRARGAAVEAKNMAEAMRATGRY